MAPMGLIGWLALRGMVEQRLSLALMVIAIAIGVGFQIPNTANLAGSSATLLDEGLVWGAGDVRVEPRGRSRFPARIGAQIERAMPGSRTVPVIILPGGISGAATRFLGAPVLGVDFATAPVKIASGAAPVAGDLGVVLGASLARRLHVKVGDEVELRVVLGDSEDAEGGAYTMTVRGIAGNSAVYQSVFVDRAFLAAELHDPDAASAMLVHLPDHDAAAAAARTIEAAVPGVRAIDWKSDDPFLPTMLGANQAMERVSYGMVIAAISVPLLALLYIRVLRKRREIAVLRALGFTRRAVFTIHLVQSLVIGCLGSLVGAGIGYVGILVFDRYPIFTWETMVVRPLASTGTFAVPIAVAIATAALAGSAAAWRAARTDPARMLQRLD